MKQTSIINFLFSKIESADTAGYIVLQSNLITEKDYPNKDYRDIYGVAQVASGTLDSVPELKISTTTINIKFTCPVSRVKYLQDVLGTVASSVQGITYSNNNIEANVPGVTQCSFNLPVISNNYKQGEHGTSQSLDFTCFFQTTEGALYSNATSIYFQHPVDVNGETTYQWEKIIYSDLQPCSIHNTQTDVPLNDIGGSGMSVSIQTGFSPAISIAGVALLNSAFTEYLINCQVIKAAPISLKLEIADVMTIYYTNFYPTGPVRLRFQPGNQVAFSLSLINKKDSYISIE